jgi:hypothetical protein
MNLSVMGVYHTEKEVIEAIQTYEKEGYQTGRFSVLALDGGKTDLIQKETKVHPQHPASEEALGIISGFLSGISGGFAVPGMAIPGIGPLMAAGPLASYIEGTSRQDVKDLLLSCGLDEEKADEYLSGLKKGKIILFYEQLSQDNA